MVMKNLVFAKDFTANPKEDALIMWKYFQQ